MKSNIQNKQKATGLIQFMPDTAIALGTTVEELKKLSPTEQLDYVYKYFKPYTNKIYDFSHLYSINFYPYMLDKGSEYVIGSEKGEKYTKLVAKQNKGIDLNKDNKITSSEFKKYAYKDIPKEWLSNMA